ncbi:MAG: DUF4291 family protein [Acidiferrobacteraceae bacterium]
MSYEPWRDRDSAGGISPRYLAHQAVFVLGIDITRAGFEWALEHAVLSAFSPAVHGSHERWQTLLAAHPVRIQWDPERDGRLQPVPGMRTIQIGLSGEALAHYVNQWIVRIEDVTPIAREVAACIARGDPPPALPSICERPYPLPTAIATALGAH